MPVDLTAIRALLASVAGFTEGPWRADDDLGWVYPPEGVQITGFVQRKNRPVVAAAPDLHRELTEAVGEIEIRDRQQAGTQAMLDGIWRTLDAAGVRDDVDERYMQQVSEHCYEPAGEYRQADPEERVGFLAAEVVRLRAHNARMVALLNKVANAMDLAEHALIWTDGAEIVTNALPSAAAIRRLASGEVDDV